MSTLYTNFCYPTEIHDVAKLFFDDVELTESNVATYKLVEQCVDGEFAYLAQTAGLSERQSVNCNGLDELRCIRLRKRYAKLAMYRLLERATGRSMPWGSLTGIRPTKLAEQLAKEGEDWQKSFTQLLGVSQEKTNLVADILRTQGVLRQRQKGSADLYVGIPFCVSRCSYCSFTSGEIDRLKKYVAPYVEALKNDIIATLRFAHSKGIGIRNVYFGGGTPTSLSAAQLDDIMNCIDVSPVEYTVEAGRPDTLDAEKLAVLKSHGVQRISVNPQTFNQSVLDVIGRKHSVEDIYEKYRLAKSFGFDVNMDLIAGLPTETYPMFCHSVDEAIRLAPENITVHTLALKHGSALKEQSYSAKDVANMVQYAQQAVCAAGYAPYYMYRQKYMADNLENVGYCKKGKMCLYNIGIMEEVSDILACGTNAISKRILSDENRIERAANAKDVITYIQRNEEYLQRKFKLFE